MYNDTSATWGRAAFLGSWATTWDEAVPYMRAAVRGLLEERLDRINANASRAATYLARAGLRGSEVATMEQLLCARADVLIMCARREGCSCGRGLESGFVSTIHSHRGMSGLSTRVNERGGVWSYVERPGWDLRAASRVSMSGRAGELARRHPRALTRHPAARA